MRMPILEVLEMVERLFAVEDPNVLRLRRRQAPDGPTQVHEVRLDRRVHRMHADLVGQVVRFPGVARAAGGDDVGPVVRATAGEWNEVVACQRFPRLELDLKTSAVLAAVAVAREQEGVRNLPAEAAWDMDEAHEPDYRRARQRQPLGANHAIRVCLDDFRLPIDNQPQRAAHRDHRQWLKRSIQCQTTNDQALLLGEPTKIYNWYSTTTREADVWRLTKRRFARLVRFPFSGFLTATYDYRPGALSGPARRSCCHYMSSGLARSPEAIRPKPQPVVVTCSYPA